MAPAVAAEKEEGPSTTKNDIMIDQSQHALPVKRDASGEMKSAELATEEVLEAMDRNSDFFLNNPGRELPSFKSEEITIGLNLGQGEFGIVREVAGIKDTFHTFGASGRKLESLKEEAKHDPEQRKILYSSLSKGVHLSSRSGLDSGSAGGESSSRAFTKETGEASSRAFDDSDSQIPDNPSTPQDPRVYMMERCYRGSKPRYAVKRVRPDLSDDAKYTASIDLATEAKILASLDHSNVIRIRATVNDPGSENYMIVIDRLYALLDHRINEWSKKEKSFRGRIFSKRIRKKEDYRELVVDRLVALFDIARAVRHLHSKKIMYRDLKPENIGCDIREDYRIFDFGLAKELKEDMLENAPDGYRCTGLTGSRRWMAPENCLCRPYGLKVDVYAFGLLFWSVMALKTPFPGYSKEEHFAKVVQKNERPNPQKAKVGAELQDMMVGAWDPNPSNRPDFEEICTLLKFEIANMKYSKREYGSMNNRSLHLLDQSMVSWFGDTIRSSIRGNR